MKTKEFKFLTFKKVIARKLGYWKHYGELISLVKSYLELSVFLYFLAYVINQDEIYLAFGLSEKAGFIGFIIFLDFIWASILQIYNYFDNIYIKIRERKVIYYTFI